MSVGCVGYSFISGSLSCALGSMGTSRAKVLGVDLHTEVMYFCSVWHSAHVVLGMMCICCTMGMCGGFAVELSGLNLGSGNFRNVDEVFQTGLCMYVQSDSARK